MTDISPHLYVCVCVCVRNPDTQILSSIKYNDIHFGTYICMQNTEIFSHICIGSASPASSNLGCNEEKHLSFCCHHDNTRWRKQSKLCILIEVISISDVYIYLIMWRERKQTMVLSLLFFNAFCFSILLLTELLYFPSHIYRCISLISGLYSHDLRIMAAILQNKKPNGAVDYRRREASIMLRPE